MFNELFRNIYYAKISKYSAFKKAGVLITLVKLSLKQKFYKPGTSPVSERFFDYTVKGLDYASLSFLYKELFCSDDYFFKATSQAPVIIDCGANIGMATLYFKYLYPDAKIVAFEPNPQIYKLLKSNIETNHISNTELHNIALYNEEKELSFFTGDESGNLRGSILEDRGRKNEIVVKAKKLSDYLRTTGKVDLIKIDVEGAELNIIQDLFDSSMLQKADQYVIEYHHNINEEKPGLSAFLAKFESSGFNYSVKATFYRIKGFQEILLYFYKQ